MTHETADIIVSDMGTVWSFRGASAAGRSFLTDEVESESWQWMADRLIVDWRPAQALLDALTNDTALIIDLV